MEYTYTSIFGECMLLTVDLSNTLVARPRSGIMFPLSFVHTLCIFFAVRRTKSRGPKEICVEC